MAAPGALLGFLLFLLLGHHPLDQLLVLGLVRMLHTAASLGEAWARPWCRPRAERAKLRRHRHGHRLRREHASARDVGRSLDRRRRCAPGDRAKQAADTTRILTRHLWITRTAEPATDATEATKAAAELHLVGTVFAASRACRGRLAAVSEAPDAPAALVGDAALLAGRGRAVDVRGRRERETFVSFALAILNVHHVSAAALGTLLDHAALSHAGRTQRWSGTRSNHRRRQWRTHRRRAHRHAATHRHPHGHSANRRRYDRRTRHRRATQRQSRTRSRRHGCTTATAGTTTAAGVRNDDVGVVRRPVFPAANRAAAREPIGAATALAAGDRELALHAGIFLRIFLLVLRGGGTPGLAGLSAERTQPAPLRGLHLSGVWVPELCHGGSPLDDSAALCATARHSRPRLSHGCGKRVHKRALRQFHALLRELGALDALARHAIGGTVLNLRRLDQRLELLRYHIQLGLALRIFLLLREVRHLGYSLLHLLLLSRVHLRLLRLRRREQLIHAAQAHHGGDAPHDGVQVPHLRIELHQLHESHRLHDADRVAGRVGIGLRREITITQRLHEVLLLPLPQHLRGRLRA